MIIIISLLGIVFKSAYTYSYQVEFSQEGWEKNIFEREYMVGSLEKKHKLSTITYSEIIGLLGVKGLERKQENEYLYYIIGKGPLGGNKYLLIYFYGNGDVRYFQTSYSFD